MDTVCEHNKCAACMACVEVCSQNAIKIMDELNAYNAVVDKSKCVNCGMCYRVCQNNFNPETVQPVAWYQGWAKNENIRRSSSSGGFATAIAKGFIENNGIVYSCIFKNGMFTFDGASHIDEIGKFSGSKYVKSNPAGVYKKIKQDLIEEKKVLFTGLPCQVAALKQFVGQKQMQNLYTVDLICHGTPSPENLKAFLQQYGYNINHVEDISFRKKSSFRLSENKKTIVEPGVLDSYTLAFLNSVNYTENCYACKYAKRERVSNLTIGDSWGSTLHEAEKNKGISLVLCMDEKGKILLEQADLHLEDVDLENAVRFNRQLEKPSLKPQCHDKFFEDFKKGVPYNKLVAKALPRQWKRQKFKSILYRLKLLNIFRGGVIMKYQLSVNQKYNPNKENKRSH